MGVVGREGVPPPAPPPGGAAPPPVPPPGGAVGPPAWNAEAAGARIRQTTRAARKETTVRFII
ncbi:MAG: hypothetical protein C0504_06350 [Candidatus Solibacter sp.]|nr:hypothetical protein [Candidatus Solibacter sp.]